MDSWSLVSVLVCLNFVFGLMVKVSVNYLIYFDDIRCSSILGTNNANEGGTFLLTSYYQLIWLLVCGILKKKKKFTVFLQIVLDVCPPTY